MNQYHLPADEPWFTELADGVRFERGSRGREGAVLVADDVVVPLVRSTTQYAGPHQVFRPALIKLAAAISYMLPETMHTFNNALVERYDYSYRTMGAHSDMAIDLAHDSLICLFSCYNNGGDIRSLVCTDKDTGIVTSVALTHNSFVTFSTALNRRMRHKIVASCGMPEDRSAIWLGVTLRVSKRALTFGADSRPWLRPGVPLVLADDKDQRAHLYKRRGLENKTSDVVHCDDDVYCNCTVSPSDLLVPTK